jgi:hypothetical protein
MSEIGNQKPAALAEMKKSARIARINSAKDLVVYKAAYELAMKIFELSKRFPTEEKFALTSQIRRSSRSVCLNLREARQTHHSILPETANTSPQTSIER